MTTANYQNLTHRLFVERFSVKTLGELNAAASSRLGKNVENFWQMSPEDSKTLWEKVTAEGGLNG